MQRRHAAAERASVARPPRQTRSTSTAGLRVGVRVALLVSVIVAAACSPTFNWREFRSPEGFVVLLPGRPQTVARTTNVADTPVQMTMTSTGIGGTLFAVGSARLPAALTGDSVQRQRALGSLRDSLVRNVNGRVVKTPAAPPPTMVGGISRHVLAADAIEALGINPDGRAVRLSARLFIVDDQLFQVVALGVEDEIPADAFDTFFTSFRLVQ